MSYGDPSDKRHSKKCSMVNLNRELVSTLTERPGVYTSSQMSATGFQYTGNGDAARCKDCGLEISNWTADMIPFNVHSKQKPDCPFVRSVTPYSLSNASSSSSSSTTAVRNTSISNEQQNPSERKKIGTIGSESSSNTLFETDLLQQVRRRTFSHWPHRTIPSSAQIIEAGSFNCILGDRVICIYCNLICQQGTPHTDDPCEVHKTLSSNCPYVKAELIRPSASSIIIVNESLTVPTSSNHSSTSANLDPLRSNEIVYTAACNPAYAELPKRHASFATWPHKNLSPVDDLVRAGFFYTGTKTIVTCFYCNGSLQKWRPNDNPMIEHARWFPHCAYAEGLCGDEMYRKIQEAKRAQQECASANESREKASSGVMFNSNITTDSGKLLTPDESTLSRLVAARLDLPISQRLLDRNFKLSVIKRCWEDQLRLREEDFVSECDLYFACLILRKQIEHIDGKKENIVIPRFRMKHIGEGSPTNFTEDRDKRIQREKSFRDWPHSLPSRIDMIISGWRLDTTKGKDFTICSDCGVECIKWESNDNPLCIHRGWSPSCPYILSSRPMHPSSAPIRPLDEILTPPNIAIEAVRPVSNVILISKSCYAQPPIRAKSFSTFPGESPQNMDALVASGFYYVGIATLLQCYNCGGAVNDFHQHPSNEINVRHHERFPHCRFAQLLIEQNKTRSMNNASLCKWCLVGPNELATYPCMHLAVCSSCAHLINTCPICGEKAQAVFKIYK